MKRWVFLLALAALACSKQHPSPAKSGPRILAHVPGETPYVAAAIEPWSREMAEAYLAEVRPQLGQSIAKMKEMSAGMGPGYAFVVAVMEELAADFTVAGAERLGFNPQARAVIYGLGLMPAARIEVSDAAKIEALINRCMQKSGFTLSRESWKGRSYWAYKADPTATLVIALDRGELLVLLAPASMTARFLPLLFGEEKLGPSLAETGELERVAREQGYGPHFAGYIDFVRAATSLTDEKQPLVRETIKALGDTPPPASCRPELERLASVSPRWTLGFSVLEPRRASGSVRVELSPGLARDLMAVRTPVAGVGAPLGNATLAFGAAVDVGRLVDLVRRGAEGVLAQPYRCEILEWVNQAASEVVRDFAASNLPGWVGELRGFAAVLESVEPGLAFPTIKAHGLLAASDPIQLIDLAKRGITQLSGLEIPPDGRPVPIPGGLLPLMTGHVAMKGQLLGLSLGSGSEVKLVQLMSTAPLPSQPVLHFAFDGKKFLDLMQTISKMAGGEAVNQDEGNFAFSQGNFDMLLTVNDQSAKASC